MDSGLAVEGMGAGLRGAEVSKFEQGTTAWALDVLGPIRAVRRRKIGLGDPKWFWLDGKPALQTEIVRAAEERLGMCPGQSLDPFWDRNLVIVQMRTDGHTLTNIAERYGISRQRVSQIVRKMNEQSSVQEIRQE